MDLERTMVLERIFHSFTFAVFYFRFNQSGKKKKPEQKKPKPKPKETTTRTLLPKKQQTKHPQIQPSFWTGLQKSSVVALKFTKIVFS